MGEHSVGKTIAVLRKSKGWTQVELAEKLNVSDKAVSKWESEAGFPEISQLPVMAKLFNVTIDYIMTGEQTKKDIIVLSKAEYCAKNDDVSLAETVKDLPKDENEKNIVDYILEYQSLKVFKKLCEVDRQFIKRFKIIDAITLALLSNSLEILRGEDFYIGNNCRFFFENEDDIKSLLPVEDKEYFQNYQDQCTCIVPRDFFLLIATDKRINETTLNTLLSKQRERNCFWYHAIPYLIDEAYINNNEALLRRLIEITVKNNKTAYETITPCYDRNMNTYSHTIHYFFVSKTNGNTGYGLIRILESTIKKTMERGDFTLLDELNSINISVNDFVKKYFDYIHESFSKSKCYTVSKDELRIAMLKFDKSISQFELQAQAAIHNGIVSIEELKNIPDIETIKKVLFQHPIHPVELLYEMYKQKKWRELFMFSIDFDIKELSDEILFQNNEQIEHTLLKFWSKDNTPYYSQIKNLYINDNEIYLLENNIQKRGFCSSNPSNIREIIDYLGVIKKQAFVELSNEIEKNKITGELTKEYFYSELSKGNNELVIIKLCVRMEAILKSEYKLHGDFSEMLDNFCRKLNNIYDDEENSRNSHISEMLNCLRRQRNSVVHSDKNLEPMSNDDIKECIEYICSL